MFYIAFFLRCIFKILMTRGRRGDSFLLPVVIKKLINKIFIEKCNVKQLVFLVLNKITGVAFLIRDITARRTPQPRGDRCPPQRVPLTAAENICPSRSKPVVAPSHLVIASLRSSEHVLSQILLHHLLLALLVQLLLLFVFRLRPRGFTPNC